MCLNMFEKWRNTGDFYLKVTSQFVFTLWPLATQLRAIVPHHINIRVPCPVSCVWPSHSSAWELYYSRFAVWFFFRLTFPHFHLWYLPWSVLAQWCVSSNLSCPSKRNQDEMAGAPGHPPMRYLNHRHTNAYIIAGRFCESRGMEEGLRTTKE